MFSKKMTKIDKQMNNRGVTLVEVMIGMAIFLIGFLAVSSLQVTAITGNTAARKATEAATRATNQLETLIVLPYDSIVDGGPVTQGAYTTTWEVLNDTPLLNSKTITITVDWQHHGPRSFDVTYMKSDNL